MNSDYLKLKFKNRRLLSRANSLLTGPVTRSAETCGRRPVPGHRRHPFAGRSAARCSA